jgi:hypothetical protein
MKNRCLRGRSARISLLSSVSLLFLGSFCRCRPLEPSREFGLESGRISLMFECVYRIHTTIATDMLLLSRVQDMPRR